MKNPLANIMNKRQVGRRQDAKERILKQRELILDAFSESIKGARTCPLYMGGPCQGSLCEFFQEYTNTTNEGKKTTYSRCTFNQTPILLIEIADLMRTLIAEQRNTQKLMCDLAGMKGGPDADNKGE